MKGIISSIPNKNDRPANWCFIKGEDGKEYFLHISELFDRWDKLKSSLAMSGNVTVEFETTMGDKGPRAVGAKIVND